MLMDHAEEKFIRQTHGAYIPIPDFNGPRLMCIDTHPTFDLPTNRISFSEKGNASINKKKNHSEMIQ